MSYKSVKRFLYLPFIFDIIEFSKLIYFILKLFFPLQSLSKRYNQPFSNKRDEVIWQQTVKRYLCFRIHHRYESENAMPYVHIPLPSCLLT